MTLKKTAFVFCILCLALCSCSIENFELEYTFYNKSSFTIQITLSAPYKTSKGNEEKEETSPFPVYSSNVTKVYVKNNGIVDFQWTTSPAEANSKVYCVKEGSKATFRDHEMPLFEEKFWGEWVRMDTGETYYFANNYWMIDKFYYTNPVSMELQSKNVIKVTEGTQEYFLYASRIRNSTFGASAVKDDGSRSLFARVVNVPKGTTAVVEAVKNGMDKQTVQIGEEGELEADNIIAGDDYIVTIDSYEFTVTPNTDGDNVGTLTLTDGVNMKTSIVPQSPYTDMMRLYSGKSYNLTIKFTNVGDTKSTAMSYWLKLPPELKITGNVNSSSLLTSGNLNTFMPGDTQNVNITILCEPISEEFEFKDITIETQDVNGKKWTDSVSLKINREWVTFNMRSNKVINGVVIVPNGKAYYFKTSIGTNDLYSAEIAVPKKYQKDYLIVFSGASAATETMYSFAVDRVPAVNFSDYLIIAPELNQYKPNGTEGQAAAINYDQEVMAYLLMNEANYYKVRFTN
jgi:hypothetical protein